MTDIPFYLKVGLVGFFFMIYQHRKPTKPTLKQDMIYDFKNKIINWKRINPDQIQDYVQFLKDTFPENIQTHKGRVISVDPRVMNDWLSYFKECHASDTLHKIEPFV